MTEQPDPRPHLRAMEGQVLALAGLATIVRLLGSVPVEIDIRRSAIGELGRQLEELVEVLEDNWSGALRAAATRAP